MKLKVTKRYVDRFTKKIVEEGAVIEAGENRAKELIGQKVAEPVESLKKESKSGKVAPVQQEG